MQTKMIEIRDDGTCIAALAILMTPANEIEAAFLGREGFVTGGGVVLMRLSDQEATSDPYSWRGGTRTMPWAHDWIISHWDEITEGQVLDVRVTQGMTTKPVGPEIFIPRHANGQPKYAADGTLLDERGNRSVFDDVDE